MLSYSTGKTKVKLIQMLHQGFQAPFLTFLLPLDAYVEELQAWNCHAWNYTWLLAVQWTKIFGRFRNLVDPAEVKHSFSVSSFLLQSNIPSPGNPQKEQGGIWGCSERKEIRENCSFCQWRSSVGSHLLMHCTCYFLIHSFNRVICKGFLLVFSPSLSFYNLPSSQSGSECPPMWTGSCSIVKLR